jgi:transposase
LDTSDAEWAILAPQIPAGSGRGRPVCYPRRDVVDAIRYLDRTGCQWAALPADFPHYFKTWTADGTLTRIHDSLREQVRVKVEHRTSQPSAALIDSQSVRAAETVGRASRGYDVGKNVNGRKRHIVTDTCGLLLAVAVTGANVQDRDAARLLLWALRPLQISQSMQERTYICVRWGRSMRLSKGDGKWHHVVAVELVSPAGLPRVARAWQGRHRSTVTAALGLGDSVCRWARGPRGRRPRTSPPRDRHGRGICL